MIEYILLLVAFVIVGIQGYLIAKIHALKRDEKREEETVKVVLFHDQALANAGQRIQRIENSLYPGGVDGRANAAEIPDAPKDKPNVDWMEKYSK